MKSIRSSRTSSLTKFLALSLGLAVAGVSAQAAVYTWDPTLNPSSPAGGAGTWNTSTTNWSDGASDVVWGNTTADTAVFSGTAGSVSVGSALNVGTLRFLTSGYSLTGSAITLGAGGTGGIDASTLTSGTTTIANNITMSASGGLSWNVGGGSTLLYTGVITDNNPWPALTKTGAGLLRFANSAGTTFGGGALVVNAGTVEFATGGSVSTGAQITVGNSTANARLVVSGGSAIDASGANPNFNVGTVSGANGFLFLSSGTLQTTNNQINLGAGNGATSADLTITGGTFIDKSYVVVGFNNDHAVFNQSGGSATIQSNLMTIAAGGSGSVGVATISGGSFTSTANGMLVGERGTGVLNVSGTAAIALAGNGLTLGPTGSQTGWNGTANLLGGTVTTNKVAMGPGSGTGTLNFNGGTVKASGANASFLTGLTNAYVYSGGGTIDNNGNGITIGQTLKAPAGYGVSSIPLSGGGSGYLDTPIVTISGGTGTGAQAVANIDYATGQVTGITITNPGTGYASGDTLTVSLTGGGGAGATIGTVTLAANTSGAMTFSGAGNTTLTGLSTYTGGTIVNSGTLSLGNGGGAGAIRGSLTINSGATVKTTVTDALGYNGGTAVTTANVNGGTLDNAAAGNQGFITNVALTGGSVTSSGSGAFNFNTGYGISSNASSTTSVVSAPVVNRGGSLTFTVAQGSTPSGVDLSVSGTITENGGSGITKAGSGTMLLSSSNAYGGTTTVSAGTLRLGNANALGVSGTTGVTTVGSGGAIDLNGMTIAEQFGNTTSTDGLSGTGFGGNGVLINSSATPATITGNIFTNAFNALGTGTNGFTVGSGDITLAGIIDRRNGGVNSLNIQKIGSGTLTITGTANGSILPWLILNSGTAVLARSGNLSSVGGVTINGGVLKMDPNNQSTNAASWSGQIGDSVTMNGGAWDLNDTTGVNNRIKRINGSAGTVTNSGTGTALLRFGFRDNNNGNYSGTITDGANGGKIAILAENSDGSAGGQILAGNNSYSGGTTLNSGAFIMGHNNAFGTGPVRSAATIDLAGFALGNALENNGNGSVWTNSSASTAMVSQGFNTAHANDVVISDFAIAGASGAINWTGDIYRTSGVGTINKSDLNTVTFGGVVNNMNLNATAGTTVVSGTIGGAITLTVGPSATANVSGKLDGVDTTAVSGALSLQNGSTYKFDINTNGVNDKITGSGTLSLDGAFEFNLAGADAISGNSWLIVDNTALSETYGATFAVSGFSDIGNNQWQYTSGNNVWTFDEGSGSLSVLVVPEPSVGLMILSGIATLGVLRRNRRN